MSFSRIRLCISRPQFLILFRGRAEEGEGEGVREEEKRRKKRVILMPLVHIRHEE